MGKFLSGLRISVMSVHEGWWYAYLAAFFLQMTAWTLMVAWDEAAYGDHTRVAAYLRAVGAGSSHIVQLFVLNTIGIVELGRLIMVLAQGIADRLKERKEKFRAELIAQGVAEGIAQGVAQGEAQGEARGEARGRAEGIAEGRAEGISEGRAELVAEVVAWNERRLAADAKGEPFDEPPPGVEG